jgi:hypothetical protein
MTAMTEEQVKELYKVVAEGITKLHNQSESAGDDVSVNPARVHFLALSGYLAANGVLTALNAYADYILNPEDYPEFTPEKLPIH